MLWGGEEVLFCLLKWVQGREAAAHPTVSTTGSSSVSSTEVEEA